MIIKKNYLKKNNLENQLLYTEREAKTLINTLIIHSAFLSKNMLRPNEINFDTDLNSLLSNSFSKLNEEEISAEERNEVISQIDSIIGINLKETFKKLSVNNKFSVIGIKTVFESLGVSAHYIIDRKGIIHELVDPKFKAFHAGKSCLPNTKKENVNEFSIGVELLASSKSKVTNKQYRSLSKLIDKLRVKYPISNFYGHNHIAQPAGRKIDPEGFNWNKFINTSEIYKIPYSNNPIKLNSY